MSDITSTTFGYIIAFLLPGLVGLYGLGYYFTPVRQMFLTFVSPNANVGLLLLVVAGSLVVGLVVTTWRYLLFEKWLCRKHCVNPEDFVRLDNPTKLAAYRAAIDETYRYHQFFGGLAVVLPVLFVGWFLHNWQTPMRGVKILSVFLFILTELGVVLGAMVSYQVYVARAKRILADHPIPILPKEDLR
jgi:hypothetical protein